jgi:hypothetical protein
MPFRQASRDALFEERPFSACSAQQAINVHKQQQIVNLQATTKMNNEEDDDALFEDGVIKSTVRPS